MDCHVLILLACTLLAVSVWSAPLDPGHPHNHPPHRVTRDAHDANHHKPPAPGKAPGPNYHRHKRDYDELVKASGVTGPVHTFVKTDKNANYKWGVRHHVGNKYA